jgi:hypothetical protein
MSELQNGENAAVIAQLGILDAIEKLSHNQVLLGMPDAKVAPLEKGRDISQDHWVASVLLDTSKAQVYFRVHFATSISRKLLADHLHSDPKLFEPTTAHDHLREFCNVVMGRIKGALAPEIDLSSQKKVFLPKLDPSYDKYKIIPTGNEKVDEERWWRITGSAGELILYARARSEGGFSAEVLKGLSQVHVIIVSNDGDIELL